MKSKISVYESSLELFKDIARDVFKDEDVMVVLFGSRGSGDHLETSDMDVGILSMGEVNKSKITLFRERIENSNIPYKVDVVDFSLGAKEYYCGKAEKEDRRARKDPQAAELEFKEVLS